MGDLISREALIEALNSSPNIRTMRGGVSGIWINLLDVVGEIERMPAAEPVRRGHWVFDENANDWGIGGYVCSECQAKNNNLPCVKVANPLMFVGANYCPNCGVNMDGDG